MRRSRKGVGARACEAARPPLGVCQWLQSLPERCCGSPIHRGGRRGHRCESSGMGYGLAQERSGSLLPDSLKNTVFNPLPPLDSLNLAASSPVNDPPPFAWTRSILLAGGRSHSLSRPRSFLLAQRNGRQWKREPTLAPAISPSARVTAL